MKTELGVYAFINRIMNYMYLAGSPVIWVFFPYIVSAYNRKKYIDRKVSFFCQKQMKLTFFLLALGFSLFILNLEFFILLIGSEAYLSYKTTYLIYAIFPILLSIMYINQQILLIQSKTFLISVSYVVGVILNVLLNYILIINFGLNGAVGATLLTIIIIISLQIFGGKLNHISQKKVIYYPFVVLVLVSGYSYIDLNWILSNLIFIILLYYISIFFTIIDKNDYKKLFNYFKGISFNRSRIKSL